MSGISQNSAKVLVGSSILLTTAAQLLFRAGMKDSQAMSFIANLDWQVLFSWLQSVDALLVIIGIAFYAISMLVWLIALSRFEVSFAYPLLSITYILVYAVAVYWPTLGEQPSLQKLIGIAIIVGGVVLVTTSRAER